MASEEHIILAHFLKNVHSSLRQACSILGAEEAWQTHCKNKDVLKTYAHCMKKLATEHWSENSKNKSLGATSRIEWVAQLCIDYFSNETYKYYREKEINIASKLNISVSIEEQFSQSIRLLDVGSCYNPFQVFEFLEVLAIDLYPANNSVLECDFLQVPIGLSTNLSIQGKIEHLQEGYFDVVTFCFLLEYIPTSELRIRACINAYRVLKPGGLLVITTPDSKHVGANSKLMKSWRCTLAKMGFMRTKYEKLKHMHCMAFRKSLLKETAVRWADLHGQAMENAIHIPQDFQNNNYDEQYDVEFTRDNNYFEDLQELPFYSASQ